MISELNFSCISIVVLIVGEGASVVDQSARVKKELLYDLEIDL